MNPPPDRAARGLQDLIITGIPRSGTSLAAAIIDQMPDAFCLSEPEHQVALMETAQSANEFVRRLAADFAAIRLTLLRGGGVLDRRDDRGRAVTNYFGRPASDGVRQRSYSIAPVLRPGLSADFLLGIKHNALYAAVLPEIVRHSHWRVVAVLRDPVGVISSWRTLDLPISRGRLPAAERFWPQMLEVTDAEIDLIDKQIRIYDLFCRRFAALAEQIEVLRYESFVIDPAVLLKACGIVAAAAGITVPPQPTKATHEGAIACRVSAIAAMGELPGICRFYPAYASC